MSRLSIIGDAPCPECISKGRDSTGNHLIILKNEAGETFGKCNRCGFYSPPENKIEIAPKIAKSLEEIQAELQEVCGLPIQPLVSRSITEGVAKRFGVHVSLSEIDGKTQVSHYYPKEKAGQIVGYKVRNLEPKYFFSIGNARSCDPFGLAQCKQSDTGRNKLFITEDELSAMSVYQVLEERSSQEWKHIKPSVIALPDGAGSAVKALSPHLEFLAQFKEVILNLDNDDAGKKATEEILSLIPQAKVVFLPLKDANDMLMAGRGRELNSELLFHSKRQKPEGVVSVLDCLEEALEPPKMGLSYPWEDLTKLTFGQRTAEVIAVGGGVGTGKTLLAHEIAAWNAVVHNQNSFMIMLEENNGDTIKNISGKIDEIPYHRPDVIFDKEKLRKTAQSINEKIYLWKSNIHQEARYDIDSIVRAIRYQAVVNNVKHVFFDNITAVTQHLSPTEINTEVGRIAMLFAGLADELDLQIFIFSHLNTPSTGKSHEEGGEVREYQFTGSRALMRWCQVIIGFERDKQAAGETKHFSHVRLLKHRKYGTTGYIKTKYDTKTGKLTQRDEEVPDDTQNQSF